jgi:A/G-specific adenine glycosylase
MLQQTQASRVAPAFEAFITRFPTVDALADSSRGDVLREWAGLGYHRRAVALHEAARIVRRDHAGRIPSDLSTLRTLPGVGEYTAAAVASLGYGLPVAAVDTNVRRIWARVVHGAEPDEVPAVRLRRDAGAWLDRAHPASWNQAVMDLGRTVCRPAPRCGECPLRQWCRFAATGRSGRGSTRPQGSFEGSLRQVRGAVVAHLRERSPSTVGSVTTATGYGPATVADAIRGLAHDGVVDATPAALDGRPRGRIAFPD